MLNEQMLKLFNKVWYCKLFSIAGNDITVSNIVILIVLLFVGLKYLKQIASKLDRYFIGKLEPSTAQNLSFLTIYAIRFIYIIIVLSIANIPLSGFAFISGALAFALGFGAQTILSNFISGLIIMFEQLIKIGEVIKIKDSFGIVESVKMRCTILRTFSNKRVLIPNGDLLGNSVEKFNVDDKFIYKFEFIVPKQDMNMELQDFMQMLKDILNNINDKISSVDTKIFCKNIDKENINFLFKLNLNLDKVQDIDNIKDLINTNLLTKLHINSVVTNFLD